MRNFLHNGLAATILGVAGLLTSCSEDQLIKPASDSVIVSDNKQDVKVINGRLAFANVAAFDKVNKELWTKNSTDLDLWEKSYDFKPLRSVPVHYEDTLSQDLITEFGFPYQYAAIINSKGEYQIADKIYWFHEGYKYMANSEAELASIKSNPSKSEQKTVAGKIKINIPANTANRSTRNIDVDKSGDGKYQYRFPLNFDNNSQRELSLEAFIYAEDRKSNYGFNTPYIYTAVVLNEYYQYYSNGSKRWYRRDEPRTTSYNLDVAGSPVNSTRYNWCPAVLYYETLSPTARVRYDNPYPTEGAYVISNNSFQNIAATNVQHSGGDFQIGVLSTYIGVPYSVSDYGKLGFKWVFEIRGTYSAYATADPNHKNEQSGILW